MPYSLEVSDICKLTIFLSMFTSDVLIQKFIFYYYSMHCNFHTHSPLYNRRTFVGTKACLIIILLGRINDPTTNDQCTGGEADYTMDYTINSQMFVSNAWRRFHFGY